MPILDLKHSNLFNLIHIKTGVYPVVLVVLILISVSIIADVGGDMGDTVHVTQNIRISNSSDDAEEEDKGRFSVTSSDLELLAHGSNVETYGVIKITLHPTSYDWEFIPIAGKIFTDSGSDSCHSIKH